MASVTGLLPPGQGVGSLALRSAHRRTAPEQSHCLICPRSTPGLPDTGPPDQEDVYEMERKDHTLESHDKADKMTDSCGTNSIPTYTHTGRWRTRWNRGEAPGTQPVVPASGAKSGQPLLGKHKQENPRTVCASGSDSLF